MAERDDWQRVFAEQARQQGGFYFRLARRIVGEPAAAEDACQRAFLRAWQQRGRIERVAAIRGYLARAVVNECLQWRRRRRTERDALDSMPAPDRSDADLGRGVEQREWVWRAMEHLHEPTRTVVILRIVHGLKGKEVSQQLGCSASEVSRRLHHGLDTLRNALHTEEATDQAHTAHTPPH